MRATVGGWRVVVLLATATMLAACDGTISPTVTQVPPGAEAVVGRAMANVATHPTEIPWSAHEQFIVRDVILDDDGLEHVRFDRSFEGLRVVGGDLIVHSRSDGQFDEVN